MTSKYIESRHSAYVVLNKRGKHVATVQVQYPRDGAGRVLVNVRAACASSATLNAARYQATHGKPPKDADGGLWFQSATAGGYGYDKAAAALAGLIVDGHTLADHCGHVPEAERAKDRLFAAYCKSAAQGVADHKAGRPISHGREEWHRKAAKIGARFANFRLSEGRYTSLHFDAGLKRLEALGYTVIQAL